jgi:hypothetical protein
MVEIRAPAQFKAAFFGLFYGRVLQTAFEVMADTVHKFPFPNKSRSSEKW